MKRAGFDRRQFLAGLLAWCTASTAAAIAPTQRQLELFAIWHQARREGRNVLAIVVPEHNRHERGRVVGAVLDELSDRELEDLATLVPLCATVSELHLLGALVPADAWFVLLPTQTVPARPVTIDGPTYTSVEEALPMVKARLRKLARLFQALEHDADTEHEERVKPTWLSENIPGSLWVRHGVCGLVIESPPPDHPPSGASCGMGQLPERAHRFLLFLDEVAP